MRLFCTVQHCDTEKNLAFKTGLFSNSAHPLLEMYINVDLISSFEVLDASVTDSVRFRHACVTLHASERSGSCENNDGRRVREICVI